MTAGTPARSTDRGDWSLSRLERADVLLPSGVEELAAAVEAGRVPFAGGTDLLIAGLQGDGGLPPLAFTPAVAELRRVLRKGTRLWLGAAASAAAVAESSLLRSGAPAVADAAGLIGSPQIRTLAAVAANVCNASPAADTAPALLVHGTTVHLHRGAEGRALPLDEFLLGPGSTALQPGELVTALELEPLGEREGSCYRRFTVRSSMDLAFAGAAVRLRLAPDGETVERAEIALAAVGPTALTAPEAAAHLAGRPPEARVLEECGELAAAGCRPISDLRASAGYRRRLVAALVREAVAEALARARSGAAGKAVEEH